MLLAGVPDTSLRSPSNMEIALLDIFLRCLLRCLLMLLDFLSFSGDLWRGS